MRWYVLVFMSWALIPFSPGCKKDEGSQRLSTLKQKSDHAGFDVCGLITKEEIEAIQKSPVKETKNSVRSDSGFLISQCFYTTGDFSKSVSLAVTQRDPVSSGKRSVKDFWNETFGRFRTERTDNDADKNEREGLPDQGRRKGEERIFISPKKIEGIGDDAFWSPNPVGGAIYVLKKDIFIRISIGGRENEDGKLGKSEALARKAIDRL